MWLDFQMKRTPQGEQTENPMTWQIVLLDVWWLLLFFYHVIRSTDLRRERCRKWWYLDGWERAVISQTKIGTILDTKAALGKQMGWSFPEHLDSILEWTDVCWRFLLVWLVHNFCFPTLTYLATVHSPHSFPDGLVGFCTQFLSLLLHA